MNFAFKNFLPSTVFKSKKTQPSEVEPTLITDTEPVNSPEAVESVPISRQDQVCGGKTNKIKFRSFAKSIKPSETCDLWPSYKRSSGSE
jgi:hypothetical protein